MLLLPFGRDVDHARIGDDRRQPVLKGSRPRYPVAALARSVEHDLGRIDLGPLTQEVHQRRDHVLPVGPERNSPLKQHALLSRAIEDHRVVAAIQAGLTESRPEKGEGGVASVVENDGGTGYAVIGRDEQIAGEITVLIGDRDWNGGWVEQADVQIEAPAVGGEELGQLGFSVLGPIDEDIGGGVVDGGP